ncbi:PPE family protein [Nocardia amikacinitolerans]|uniref:PPE family protein n=1 Tax=Nocardia amikacinitolerans TaxID=756689 RepID=A0A285LWB3_9NOCA|nr:PPE domain-containing protein [Nocardia amikacinitolerans]MCP2277045.1 PPE family protein [Nocardia amikacinitolerans]MCP2295615.1 PPE family protein [Nocardia amikacinitolerans]SNY87946.1 PPE family protein [Nocardia amikacinitolerans]
MVEPPIPGFTGVVWEARPTEKLAKDLTTGPGTVPMAEAAQAWTRLGVSFGAAVPEYDQIVKAIGESWRSETSPEILDRITKLREWLLEAAGSAAQNAAKTGSQALAYEVARLAMPHVAEIAALEEAKKSVEAIGAGLGAPLVGAAADIDAEQDLAKVNAARVMRVYEEATKPLETPWTQTTPPVIANSAALEAEQAVAEARPTAVPATALPASFAAAFAKATPPPRAKAAYTTQAVAATAEPTPLPVETAPVAGDSSSASRMGVPAAMAPAAAMQDDDRTLRAGAASAQPDKPFEVDAGFAAAPAVIGGAAEPAPKTTASGAA